MSGVRSGSRLDQLHALRHRAAVQHEHATRRGDPTHQLLTLLAAIDNEIRAEGGTPPPSPTTPAQPRAPRPPDRATTLLTALGVTTATVRTWAEDQGLVRRGRRGRLRYEVVEAYAHHRKAGTP